MPTRRAPPTGSATRARPSSAASTRACSGHRRCATSPGCAARSAPPDGPPIVSNDNLQTLTSVTLPLPSEHRSPTAMRCGMRTTRIGQDGPESSALGLGCPALPARPGPDTDETAIATLLEAGDAGVTLLETGDFHALGGHHEMLVREALWNVPRERVLLSVSFGLQRAPDGTLLGVDARPASVKNFLTYSLRRLGTDYVDLYSPAAVDPGVPIEDTIGAIADLVQAGYVRHVGLPNVSGHAIRRAHNVHPVAAVRAEYSLFSRHAETRLLPTLRELGIGLLARPDALFRALREADEPHDGAAKPATGHGHEERGRALLEVLREIAREKDVTPV